MDANSEVYKKIKGLIKLFSSTMGPKEYLKVEEEKQYTFQDNLNYTDFYFNGGFLLRELVFDKIKNCKNETNLDFAQALFNKIINELYQNIKKRNSIIEKTLDGYLIEEDYAFATARLEEILKESKRKFRVILITDLIKLINVESCQIGNIIIKKINDNYVKILPQEIEDQKELYAILGGFRDAKSLNREQFLEKYKEYVALEVNVEGYQLEDELSSVFDSAVQKIRLVFAYLFLCDHFSKEVVKESKFKIETKDVENKNIFLQLEATGVQEYYLDDKKNPNFLKKFNTRWRKMVLSNKVFILSNETISKLKNQCHLDKFNKINQDSNIREIKNKINRALDWFLKAILEKDGTDQVISLFISLESLLSTGTEYLTAHTDDMAENIAIMLTSDSEERYKYKRNFKDNVYRLRNKIMHHGNIFSWDTDWSHLAQLKIYIVWSTLGILKRIDEITKYGNGSKAIREYFEREKLKPSIIFPPQKIENKT